MRRRPMFAPRNPEASAPLPEDFEGMMNEYDNEEYKMPAKRPRSFHLIKLSRDAAECLKELPEGEEFGTLTVENGKTLLTMNEGLIPKMRKQTYMLQVVEKKPYIAHFTIDDERKRLVIDGVFTDRRMTKPQDVDAQKANQQTIVERDEDKIRTSRTFMHRAPVHGNTGSMHISAPDGEEEGDDGEDKGEEGDADAATAAIGGDSGYVERKIVHCFMEKQYWTVNALRSQIGVSAEEVRKGLRSLLCVYKRHGEFVKHWELNEDKKKLYNVPYK